MFHVEQKEVYIMFSADFVEYLIKTAAVCIIWYYAIEIAYRRHK